MEVKKRCCFDNDTDELEKFEDIYADYLCQPAGDLDDYIFGTITEQKKHSEK